MHIIHSGNQKEDEKINQEDHETNLDIATTIEKGTTNVMDSFSEKKSHDITTSTKQYDDGGINLAKMVCLMVCFSFFIIIHDPSSSNFYLIVNIIHLIANFSLGSCFWLRRFHRQIFTYCGKHGF